MCSTNLIGSLCIVKTKFKSNKWPRGGLVWSRRREGHTLRDPQSFSNSRRQESDKTLFLCESEYIFTKRLKLSQSSSDCFRRNRLVMFLTLVVETVCRRLTDRLKVLRLGEDGGHCANITYEQTVQLPQPRADAGAGRPTCQVSENVLL